MHRTILTLFVILFSVSMVMAVDMPDAPDFKRTVNYVSWFKGELPSVSSDENAYDAYTKFMPNIEGTKVDEADWPRFFGMLSMPDHERAAAGMSSNGEEGAWPPGPGPWRPKFHDGWNGSYDKTKEVLKQYREAAKCEALVAPVKLSGDGKGGRLVSLRYPYIQYQRECALGLFEGAWQLNEGKLSINRMRSAVESNLRTAVQMRGCLSVEEQGAANAIRLEAYRNIRWAFALGVLNESNAGKVAKLLRKIDGDEVDCSPAVAGECAKWLDGLQYIFSPFSGGKGTFNGNRYREVTGQSMGGGNRFGIGARLETDPEGSGNAIRDGFEEIARKYMGRYSMEKAGEIRQAFDRAAGATNVNKGLLMGGGYGVTGLYSSAGRAECERRGAILLAELFAYKGKHKKWPKSLKDLGDKALSGVGEDSYSGDSFVYTLLGEEPFLYSVGPNGTDDGGATGGSGMDDVMLWPIPDSKLWIASCALNAMPEIELTKLSDIKAGLKDKVVVIEAEVQGSANELNKEHGRLHRINLKGQGTSLEMIYYESLQQELKPHQQFEDGRTFRIRVRVGDLDGAVKLFVEKPEDIAPAF